MTYSADYWNENWKKWLDINNNKQNEFAEKVLPLFIKNNSKTLLDIGAGQGQDSLYFANHGLEVTSMEISEHALEFIKKQKPEIKTIAADILDFNYKNLTFDVIFAHLSLHYFDYENTSKIINNIYNALNFRGLFCFKCKSTKDSLMGQGVLIEKNIYEYSDHIRHFFDVDYTKKLLKPFKKVTVSETEGFYFGKCSFIEVIAEK